MSEGTPTLSVVTPAFNSAPYITETLDSVAALTIPHEHIVIDGGSSDGTVEILSGRDDESLRWTSEPDQGQTHAVNKGFDSSRGELIAWLNADDAYIADAVREAVKTLQENPEIDAIFGFTDIVDAAGNTTRQYRCRPYSWTRFLYAGDYIATPTIIFTRKALERTGRLDETYADAADYDFYLRMFNGANVELVPHSIVRFRIHDESKTGSNLQLQLDEALQIRLGYATNPLQRGLMRGIRSAKHARDRVRPFWREV